MNKSDEEQKPLQLTHIESLPNLYANMDGNSKLYLSPNIKFKHLGEKWHIVQFICSWHRKNNNETSIILDNQVKTDNFNKHDEMLLVAFYLAKKVMLKGQDIRKELLLQLVPFVQNMNTTYLHDYLKKIRAREINFLCLSGSRNEFLKLFYDDSNNFKSKGDIERLIGNIFVAPNSPIRNKKYKKNLNKIKEIVYEIFSNSDKHGRRDIKQAEISKNIRGLSINFTMFNKFDKEYFLNNRKRYKDFLQNVTKVLVISIFDSGEGIVKKYVETTSQTKETDMTFEERKRALLEVFLPNVTSSQTPNSGMGLTYVKNNIKELKGLLSIRTSTLELFLTPTTAKEECYKDEINEIPQCVGTLVTALIPL